MARQRRKVLMDVNNHDRWIVSYADFITLLFAFFVVMYSISSVNEGKYKSLTESLGTAFSNNEIQPKVIKPVILNEPTLDTAFIPLEIDFETQLNPQKNTENDKSVWKFSESLPKETSPIDAPETNQPLNAGQTSAIENPSTAAVNPSVTEPPVEAEVDMKRELSDAILKERKQLSEVSDQLENALAPFISDNLVAVKRNDYWVELEMNSELLFLSGEAGLSKKAQPVMKEIAQVINSLPNAINVEGHTDNIPIKTQKFASNWDLSSVRATSVVQELVKEGINPTRLSAVGYGEFHPIGDNYTEEGRFKNRRVTLVLMSQAFSRYGANDEERAKLLNLDPTTKPSQPNEIKP